MHWKQQAHTVAVVVSWLLVAAIFIRVWMVWNDGEIQITNRTRIRAFPRPWSLVGLGLVALVNAALLTWRVERDYGVTSRRRH